MNVLSVFVILNILSKLKYSFILFLLLVITCTVDLFFAFHYNNHILFGILASILETNWNEAIGVSMTMFPIWASIFIVCFVLLFFSKRELKEIKLSIKNSLILLATYFFLLISSFFFTIYTASDGGRLYANFKTNSFGILSHFSKERSPLLYYIIFDLASYYTEMNSYKEYKTTERTLPAGITIDKEKKQLERVYIVVGESASSKYFSLYGYPIKTTPFLDSIQQHTPQNIIKHEGLAPAALTREAIRLTLTYSTPRNINDFYKYKNIVELFNDEGFDSYWLSNQHRAGVYDTYVVMIAQKADYQRFRISHTEDFALVDAMLPLIDRTKKQVFFLHTMGSHMPYKDGADEVDIKSIQGENIVTQYIRTIHHTDRMLEKVYNIMANDSVPSAIFYYSDHGEIIGKGHGFDKNITTQEMHNQFFVPVIAITNDAAKDIVTDSSFQRYFDKEIQSISTQNIINIISESIGYYPNLDFVQQSIEDGRYIYHVDTKCYYYKDLLTGRK